jgi:hypothetical protein
MLYQETETRIANIVSSKIEKTYALRKVESNDSPIKVGIVSCINYQNHINIRDVFIGLKSFKHDFVILGGGNQIGADCYIKSLSLELNYGFIEYIPNHFNYTEHSYFPRMFHNKRYDVDNMNLRYKYLYFDCDMIIILKNNNKKDVFIDNLLKYVQNCTTDKPTLVI